MGHHLLAIVLVLVAAARFGVPSAAADEAHAAARAVLAARCVECHGAESAESNLRLDSRAGVMAGGDFGPVVVVGRAAESELVRRVTTTNAERRMPPEGERLTREEVAALAAWIDAGLSWEGSQDVPARRDPRLDHWAWQPITKPAVPDGVPRFAGLPDVEPERNAIDHFIRATLADRGLSPSPAADRRVLIRRLFFDLIGLPPAPEEVEAFVADPDPQAYDRLVDRLLASPRYGERWARHWLDVVHYGDTHGYDKDQPRRNAWPYRDYVIRAFNADKPYGRFVAEQVAGDVLWPGTRDGEEAIGFLAAGPWDLIGHREVPETKTDGKIARHLDRDDMVATTIGTFTSVTVHCAQCHAHKFDPVSQEDYYSLQAVFAALDRDDRRYATDPEITRRGAELQARRAAAEARRRELPADAAGDHAQEHARLAAELEAVAVEERSLPPLQVAYSVTAAGRGGKPRPIHVLARGNVNSPTREVGPGTLSLVEALAARFDLPTDHAEGERRAALARWIVDPANPLTWRSIVNRVWHYHFGRGLVVTPGDFGRMGAAPTHPALLDWLAAEFRDGGGSVKNLHRLIVTSATYRQVSDARPDAAALDVDATLLWRQHRRRLEAEAVRDAVLATAGTLDLAMGGPGWQDFTIEHPQHSPHYRYDLADPEDRATWRRGVYRFVVRSQTQPFMTCLDCADPSMRVERRNESISAPQALALLNNGFMLVQARRFAERVAREAGADPAAQVERAFGLALGRPPAAEERETLVAIVAAHGLANACRTILNLNEFAFTD